MWKEIKDITLGAVTAFILTVFAIANSTKLSAPQICAEAHGKAIQLDTCLEYEKELKEQK